MNLFIDTNIFLSFYYFSSDDLEELKKLAVLLREGELTLFLPEQVIIEFRRNRANKIADALKRLREQRLNLQFPQLSKDYEVYGKLRGAQKEYERCHAELLEAIERDVSEQSLKADLVIQELFDLANTIPTTSASLIERSRLRMDLGNPPGKKGALGDAIIWEALLDAAPNGEGLHFITDDHDYSSPLDATSLNPFLIAEWEQAKHSRILSYNRLSQFFKESFPDIELASELEKDLLIRQLATSATFKQTHQVIARLSKYSDFTPSQVNEIVAAAVNNNQVHWIIEDSDVRGFLATVIDGREDQITPDNLLELKKLLSQSDSYEEILLDL